MEKKHVPVECWGFYEMKWFFDGTVERGAALRSRAAASGRWGQIFVAARRGFC